MAGIELGLAAIGVAGAMQGTFTIPMKYMPRWNWENLWLAFNTFALLVFPWTIVFLTVPKFLAIYGQAQARDFLLPCAFGVLWGVGNVLCGLGVAEVGTALGLSIVIGLAATVGSIIPLFSLHPGVFFSSRGIALVLGVTLMTVGVGVCALAGIRRDGGVAKRSRGRNFKGIVLCVLSGITSASINLALAYGEPLLTKAKNMGYSSAVAPNIVWTWTMAGSFVVNLAYCIYLMRRNHSLPRFVVPKTAPYWFLCFLMAILLTGGIFVYGYGASSMGSLGTSVGWAIFLCVTILAANVAGFIAGEWRGAERRAVVLLVAGSAVLITAAGVIGCANLL